MKTGFLLTRKLSPYTHENLLIGVFSSRIKATRAQLLYWQHVEDNDPHHDQGYMTVNLDEDVCISEVMVESTSDGSPSDIWIVCGSASGFGQVIVTLFHMFNTVDAARASAAIERHERPDDYIFIVRREWDAMYVHTTPFPTIYEPDAITGRNISATTLPGSYPS